MVYNSLQTSTLNLEIYFLNKLIMRLIQIINQLNIYLIMLLDIHII